MRWLPEWRQPGTVRADALAGLTGAIVVLPQGVAFATLAGMPVQYGLYAAMLPCIVAALFGSSRLMVTGPANAISLTTMALVTPLAVAGSPEYISLVLTLAFLVGVAALMPAWPALATLQALPGAWPPLSIPDLSIDTVRSLFGATLVMTLLALTEASAIAKAVALRHSDKLDGNQEFIGQGLANIVGSFFSAFPTSGSFNRSGVNVAAGARTPLAAVCAAVFLVVILLAVAPLARWLPLAVVGGLLFVVAWGLVDRRDIAGQWHAGWRTRAPMLVTFIATVALSLEWAIVLGITSALIAQRIKR